MADERPPVPPTGNPPPPMSPDFEPTLDAPSASASGGYGHGSGSSGGVGVGGLGGSEDLRNAPTMIRPDAERAGARIGPYKLLQQIGEGGFGSVFMAEQEKPVQRKVALKIIKLGMDTRQVVARFEQERQALAMMDHPNIARVYDAGATETGRPYFAMELVKGDPIVVYCDKNNLSIDARLELFAQVCSAVQHAHTKGIIHRDIKPSNILVSTQDGRPHTKVIDFGIAKATASKLTEKTLFTEHHQLIGTPEYMSPEQAEGSLDIDTRTDIYSLGVVLYELLTGTTPFTGKELRSAAFAEIQRMIREVDPPKPSTRLSQNTETLAGIAAARRTEPKKLGTIVRGELDWIVMKALEKDRLRRYETANGLGLDIRRYLDGNDVVAAPPSASYKLRKIVRRNKGKVAAGGAVAVALVLGLVGTIWQARAAADQRDKARQEASRALAAEAEIRRRADDLQRVADFQGQMLAQVDPMAAGIRLTDDVGERLDGVLARANLSDEDRAARMDAFIGQWSQISATDAALSLIDSTILTPAVAAIDTQFPDQPVIAATLRHVLAERYHDLGLDRMALTLGEQVVEVRRRVLGNEHPDTLQAIGNLGVYQGSLAMHAAAEASHREALQGGRRVHGDDDPITLVFMANVGGILVQTGQLDEAEAFLREVLERRRRVLGDEHPDTILSIRDWGDLLMQQGKLTEAEPYHREMLEKRRRVLGEEHPATLSALNDMAVLLRNQGRLEEATGYLREAVEKRRRVHGEVHPFTLSSMQSLGAVLDMSGQSVEAEALMRDALVKQQSLLGPDHISTLTTLGNFCVYLIGQGKFAEAEPLSRETLERRTRVMGPDHTSTLIANNVMGLVYIRQKRFTEGEPYWREAAAIGRRALGPAHPETLIYVHNLGGLASEMGNLVEAEASYREVITLGMPTLGISQPVVLSAHRRLGKVLLDLGRYAEAVEVLSAAEPEGRRAYSGTNPASLAMLLSDLGAARAGLSEFASAEANLLEAHATFVTARGEEHADSMACARTLAAMYEAWERAEPGKGYDAKGAMWRQKVPTP